MACGQQKTVWRRLRSCAAAIQRVSICNKPSGPSNIPANVDQSGDIILVNAQTEKLFGYARTELLGRKVEQLFPPRYRRKHLSRRDAFFAEPRVRPMGAGLEL